MPTRRRSQTLAAQTSGSPNRLSATDRLRAALSAEDLNRAADAAIELGSAAREHLPERLVTGFDAIHDAFALYEGSRDDDAREKLQQVGLSSPFLDWKLLLRGLIAYAAGDDARALDNWSRLAPDRLAAKLIAPLRFVLDPPFRAAQTSEAQTTLQKQGDRLVGGLAPKLRALQRLLSRPRLADAFRQAEIVLHDLKRDMPHAVDKLAECFRAAVIGHASPDNVEHYQRVFGPSSDDPKVARLAALAADEAHAWPMSHLFWQRFEQTIVDNPSWPAADRDRARALVWCRMGRNADEAARCGRRPKPNAETCYKRAIQLAPDLLEPYEQSFLMLRDRNRVAAALAAGKRLLKRFPEHGRALESMAELCRDRGDHIDALEYVQRAVAVNPLDARLRDMLADGLRNRARANAAIGKLADAENDLAEVVRFRDGRSTVGELAQATAVAFKAGDADTAEQRARAAWAIAPAAAAYSMVIEATRLKLPKPLKNRFEAEFAAALSGAPTGTAAVALAECFHDQTRKGGVAGAKSYEKKIQGFVEAALATELAEIDLKRLCDLFDRLEWIRLLKKATKRGQTRFPRNPFFPYFETICHMVDRQASGPALWKIEPLIEKTRRLAEAAPPDESIRELLRDLDGLQQRLAMPAPMMSVLNDLFGMFDED